MKPVALVCLTVFCIPILCLAGDLNQGRDADGDGAPDATVTARGRYVLPMIPPASLLIDRAHGGDFDLGGLTDFLTSQGWTVDELTSPVTVEALAGYDVFLIPSKVGGLGEFPSIDPYSPAESEAVLAFVEADHGLWCLSEYKRDPSGVNSVAGQFGVSFNDDVVLDPEYNVNGDPVWPLIQAIDFHPITEGVSSFGYYAGCCVGTESPAFAVATGSSYASSNNCFDYPPVLTVYQNGGRAVFCGDGTPLYPGYETTEGNWQLIANIAEWLATGQVVGTESMSWGDVKSLYR